MGFWGKSDAEKEAERQREEEQACQREAAEYRNNSLREQYEQVVKAVDRVKRLDPKWEMSGIYHRGDFERATKYSDVSECKPFEVSYTIPDGITIKIISRGENSVHMIIYKEDTDGSGGTTIYNGLFSRYQGEAFVYLECYIRPIIERFIETQNREKRDKELREQSIKDKFWNS